jgi:tetratricopeptide (TPR) repeat protein
MNRTIALTAAMVVLLVLAFAVYLGRFAGDANRDAQSAAALEQGIALFGQEQYDQALEVLERIPADQITDWRFFYYIGSSHMMLKDYPAAAAALEHALTLKPDEPGTLYALGVVYYKQGKLKLSKAYFAAVLEINPNDEHARGLMDIMEKLEQQTAEAQARQRGEGGH